MEQRSPTGVLTRRQWLTDFAIAALVGVLQVGLTILIALHHHEGSITGAGIALLAMGPAPLAARRRFPVTVMAVAFVTTQLYGGSSYPNGIIWLSLIVAFGTAIYMGKRLAALCCLITGYVVSVWGAELVGDPHHPTALFALELAGGLAALLAVSEWIRLRHQRRIALEHGRTEESLRRISEERLRIARDLHDILAHNISVINVQASTALHLIEREPQRARPALETITDVSHQALVELRSVLGVLRQVDEDLPLAPSPSLQRLDELTARARAAGLTVTVQREGEQPDLPANVDVVAYRVIQEALTNASRHAGGAHATVRISTEYQAIAVQIDDDGGRHGGARAGPEGNGIVGMRERVLTVGGELAVGPRPEGGFRVRATLPTREGMQ